MNETHNLTSSLNRIRNLITLAEPEFAKKGTDWIEAVKQAADACDTLEKYLTEAMKRDGSFKRE